MRYSLAMTLDEVTRAIDDKVTGKPPLKAVLKLDLGEAGVVLVDGTQATNVVSNDDREAQCTAKMSLDDLTQVIDKQLDPMQAFSLGRLRVEGDLEVAMHISSLF